MLRREYNNTAYTVSQIYNAVEQIANTEKSDYKIDGYNPDSIMLLCRTGYNWSIITEIMWDKVDAAHRDIIIECRNVNHAASAAAVQHDYEERHLNKVCELFFKYINTPSPPAKTKKSSSTEEWVAIVFAILVVATIGVFFVFKVMKK